MGTRTMSSILSRIVAPVVFGIGAYYALMPTPKVEDESQLSDEEKLMRATMRATNKSDLSALREETNRKRKEMAEAYGRQLKLEEETQKGIAEGLEEPEDPNAPKKRIMYSRVHPS